MKSASGTGERRAELVRRLRRFALERLHDPGACPHCRAEAFLLLCRIGGYEVRGSG